MALVLADRVQETTSSTGAGSLLLAGAVSGFQSFAVVGNGNTCYYCVVSAPVWEVGIGTYSSVGPTLARTTVLSNSSGTTSPITLPAGVKSVFLTYPAEKSANVNSALISGRVPFATTDGLLTDSDSLKFDGTNLLVNNPTSNTRISVKGA